MTAPDPSERAGEGLTDPLEALADKWQTALDECKATDPRWILDRSVTTVETALNELRRAIADRDRLADRMAARAGEVAEVLAAHLWHHTASTHCACGWRSPLAQLAVDGYTAHVAAALAASGLVGGRADQARAEGAVKAEALREFRATLSAGCDAHREVLAVLNDHIDRIESGEAS